ARRLPRYPAHGGRGALRATQALGTDRVPASARCHVVAQVGARGHRPYDCPDVGATPSLLLAGRPGQAPSLVLRESVATAARAGLWLILPCGPTISGGVSCGDGLTGFPARARARSARAAAGAAPAGAGGAHARGVRCRGTRPASRRRSDPR